MNKKSFNFSRISSSLRRGKTVLVFTPRSYRLLRLGLNEELQCANDEDVFVRSFHNFGTLEENIKEMFSGIKVTGTNTFKASFNIQVSKYTSLATHS